jgi:hypothetical protein
MGGWVCRLQLLLVLARAVILRFESHGTLDLILLYEIRDSPNLEGEVTVFISPSNRVARLYPQTLGSIFVASTRYLYHIPPRSVIYTLQMEAENSSETSATIYQITRCHIPQYTNLLRT